MAPAPGVTRVLADPAAFGLDVGALTEVVEAAERSGTEALLIAKDGEIVASSPEVEIQKPFALRSVTKSIVGLALGAALDRGEIASLAEPLTSFFPSLRGRKRAVRLRHLMTHTSGMSPRGPVTPDWNAEAYLRTARVRSRPGSHYGYSDAATELLADVVARATGARLDELVDTVLFRPLRIEAWRWQRRSDGTPHVAYGLELNAGDLLRIGLLVADGGKWNGRTIVSRRWLIRLLRPGSVVTPHYSLLWYLRGVVVGQSVTGRSVPEARGLYAHGWLGQQLVVYPRARLVGVRLHGADVAADQRALRCLSMPAFPQMLERTLG